MRTKAFFLFAILFSTAAQAGSLFPPVGAMVDGKCPAGSIIYWTGEALECTPIAKALGLPTCEGSNALQFNGTAFTCADDFGKKSDEQASACPVQCSNLPKLNYCQASTTQGTTNFVPANAVIKKTGGTYAAIQGTTAERDECTVNGTGGLICTYGCTNGTWMLLNFRKKEVF